MLIQLLIGRIYIKQKVSIRIPLKYRIDKSSNTVKSLTIPILMGSVFQDNTFIDVSQLKRFRKKTHESTFSFLSTYLIIGYNFAKANYIYVRSPKNNSSPKNEILKTYIIFLQKFFFFCDRLFNSFTKTSISQSFWVPQNKESHTVSEQHKSGLHFWVNYTMTNIFLSGHFADLDQSPNTWQLIWCQIMQKYLPLLFKFLLIWAWI